MKFFENNCKILEQTHPGILEQVRASELEQNGNGVKSMDVLWAKSSYPTLQVQKNGHEILLHSAYDPLHEASRFVSSYNITNETKIVIVLGMGLGYHVFEILRSMPKHARLIIIERDPRILHKAMELVDFSFLGDSRVSLFCDNFQFLEMGRIVYNLFFPKIPDEKNIVIVSHYASSQLYPEYYHKMRCDIKDFISQFAVVINTHIYVSTKWSVNFLKNIDEVLVNPPLALLFEKNKGKPAIVVSAGPSLDKNIDLLKEIQDKALILAVGTSLKPLLKRGIKPHLVVGIDADERHFEHFRGVSGVNDVGLVYDGMIFPRILDEFGGMKFTCDTTESPIKNWVYKYTGNKGIIPSGFSVATTAFTLAYQMGSNPVILIGQDLSFRSDGHTHAKGTTFENDVLDVSHQMFVKIPGNVDEFVNTSHVFLSTLRWFESAIAEKSLFCINATEGGARMKGAKVMTLREAIDTYCNENLNFDYIKESFQKNTVKEDVLKNILNDLDSGIKSVEDAQKMALQGAQGAQHLHDDILGGAVEESPKFQKKARRIQKFVEELKSKEEIFFIDPWMQEVYVFLQKTQEGIKELEEYSKTMQEINRAGVFFEGVHRSSVEVLPLLAEARRRVKRVYNELYGKVEDRQLRVLTFNGAENSMMLKYIHEDCLKAMSALGHNVVRMELAEKSCLDKSYLVDISGHKPDIIFAMDNQGLHPYLMDEVKIPVLNYCMDDPHLKNNTDWIRQNHFLFVTEKDDVSELRDTGFGDVHQLEIGGSPERFFRKVPQTIKDYEKYACDISFVALSLSNSFKVFEQVPDEIRDVIARVLELLGKNLHMTIEQAIESLGLTNSFGYSEKYVLEKGLRFVTRRATANHRLMFLEKIKCHAGFKLFGDEGWDEVLPDAPYLGRIDYGAELVDVYNASKINLGLNNYGLVGIHSRVLDIALCQAFGLFEYTAGLEKYFTNGEDIAWFKTPEEMTERIEHYLARPDERERIANNAYKNVLENHTFKHRMQKMISVVMREM